MGRIGSGMFANPEQRGKGSRPQGEYPDPWSMFRARRRAAGGRERRGGPGVLDWSRVATFAYVAMQVRHTGSSFREFSCSAFPPA